MSESAPRSWKEFDSRWSRASSFQKFIIASVALHVLIVFGWVIPVRMAEARRQEFLVKKEELKAEREKKMKEEVAKVKDEVREQEKEELAETQLKEFFEDLVKDSLKKEEAEKKWDEMKYKLSGELAELAKIMENDKTNVVEAEEKIEELKEKLIDELYDSLTVEAQQDRKEKYLDIAKQVAEQMKEDLKKELKNNVGKPLVRNTEAIFKEEVSRVKKDIDQAKNDLRDLQKDLSAASNRLHEEVKNMKGEEISRASANEVREISNMEKAMQDAAQKASELSPETEKNIVKAKDELVSKAKDKVEMSSEAATKKDVGNAIEARKEAAGELAAARQETEKALDGLNKLDPEKIARERLGKLAAELERTEMRRDFDAKFEKEYMEKEMPKVVEHVEQQFQADVKKLEITPPEISIKKELAQIFGKDFVEKVDAGKTSTGELVESKKLDKETGKPQDGVMEKNAAAEMRKNNTELAESAISKTVADVAKRMNANADKMLAKADGVEGNVDFLLDRLGNMKNQLAKGRKDMLGTANQAGLMAARNRMRQRSSFLDQHSGANGLENRYSYMIRDSKTYLAMIEKMKDRSNKTGEVMSRVGAKGNAAKDVASIMSEPEYVLASEKITAWAKDGSERKLQQPAFEVNRFMGIPYINRPIKIDGDNSEWKELGSRPERLTWLDTNDDAKAYFQAAYNNDGLYFMIEAEVDDNGSLNDSVPLDNFWTGDCVEVFIDANNTKFRRRGEAHTRQFFVFPLGHASERNIGGYESIFDANGTWSGKFGKFPLAVFPRAGRKTNTGWFVEFMIPCSLFSGQQLEPGRIIGFTLSCCMGDGSYSYWAHTKGLQPSTNPLSWGDMQFLGSDGEISIGQEGEKDKDGKPVQSTILVPGKPLEITVRDGDMDLDSRAKDKVQVTVSAASGSYVDVVLEETSASSGVFTGKVATRPNIGVSVPNVIDVYEGEMVKVTYIDQARAYGERNVRIVKETRAQSGGELFVRK